MELIASREVCEIFAGLMSGGLDLDQLEVRETEDDIDFLCDNDPEPIVPTWEDVYSQLSAIARLDWFIDEVANNEGHYHEHDLQEQLDTYDYRLTKGIKAINKVEKEKQEALERYLEMKKEHALLMDKLNIWKEKFNTLESNEKREKSNSFFSWQQALWGKANPILEERNKQWKEFEACKAKISKYWDAWKRLLEEKRGLPNYHRFMNEDISKYFTSANSEEIDSQELLYRKDYSEDLAFAHMEEMKAYKKEVFVNWDFQNKRMNDRLVGQSLDFESLLQSAPF